MTKLTDRQERVMRFVQDFSDVHGKAPKLTELMAGCEMNARSRAHAAITALCKAGYLERTPNMERGLKILKRLPDRFEEAAKAVCVALHQDTTADNVTAAKKAMENVLIGAAA